MSWAKFFSELAVFVSQKSKDTSTKVGSVLVGPNNEIRSTGYNGIPIGVDDDKPERFERPEKYYWFSHSERNAIYLAARCGQSTEGCTLYTQWIPCMDCARGIVQAGIKCVVINNSFREYWERKPKWSEHAIRTVVMFAEAGVELLVWNPDSDCINPYMGSW